MIDNSNIGEILSLVGEEYTRNRKPIVTKISERRRDPFHILISTLLSLRTKDEVTEEASKRLFDKAGTLVEMIQLSAQQIEQLIYPVGFYRRKAEHILQVCNILLDEYDGKVPDEMDKLLALPGVGRKTANLVITLGYDKYGICVDTHVHRISNRWDYVRTKTPEQTEMALRKKLPKEYWKIYNDYLVSFGQHLCKPISPFCSKCPIETWCPKRGVEKHR
ncbi:MAG TPA: endonuclease III [Candidatus Cloacimonetes bacterium]|nr:endonuclease III [Candidatus Cloacimonadota bacterium]